MVGLARRMRSLNILLKIRSGPGSAILGPNVTKLYLQLPMVRRKFILQDEGTMAYVPSPSPAKHFWRKYLPRLKYQNPQIPMTVNVTRTNGPEFLDIYFSSPEAAAAAAVKQGQLKKASASPSISTSKSKSKSTPTPTPTSTSTPAPTPAPKGTTPENAADTIESWEKPAANAVRIELRRRSLKEALDEFYEYTSAKVLEPTAEDVRQREEMDRALNKSGMDRLLMKKVTAKKKHEEELLARAKGELAGTNAA